MGYEVYASPVAVPEARRGTMIGLRFDTEAQALERACSLLAAGWHVYRVSGPGGFELAEDAIPRCCSSAPRI